MTGEGQVVMDGFRANLRRIRKRAGMSQEEMGFLADLHRTEVGMLERGIRLPRIDTLIKLAGALEVEPGELLTGLRWVPSGPPSGAFRADEAEADSAKPEDEAAREGSQEQ
jgi:transcriptional regulator with XRE-family HTH domain